MTSPLRVGDRDRESTATLLGQALTQGYLSMSEYENRLQGAFGAQTADELRALTSDLPARELRRADPRRHAARRATVRRSVHLHTAGYLTMVATVLAVWLVVGLTAGSWYFWPIWPILGAGIGLLGHTAPVKYGFSPTPPACLPRRRR